MMKKIGIIEILKMSIPQIHNLAGTLDATAIRSENWCYMPGDTSLPLLVAHMDTVFPQPKFVAYDRGRNALSAKTGLGADDRAGVWACLKLRDMIRPHPAVLFLDEEESGGAGAWDASVDLADTLDLFPYFIEIDRRGKGEAVYYNNESAKFKSYIQSFGFHEEVGLFSDVSILGAQANKCSVNLSAGYYNNHTFREILVVHHLKYTMDRVKQIYLDAAKTKRKFKLSKQSKYYYCSRDREDFSDFDGRGQWQWKDDIPIDYKMARNLEDFDDKMGAVKPLLGFCDMCGYQEDTFWSEYMQGYLCARCFQRNSLSIQDPKSNMEEFHEKFSTSGATTRAKFQSIRRKPKEPSPW